MRIKFKKFLNFEIEITLISYAKNPLCHFLVQKKTHILDKIFFK